jgi:hypothetical protein
LLTAAYTSNPSNNRVASTGLQGNEMASNSIVVFESLQTFLTPGTTGRIKVVKSS